MKYIYGIIDTAEAYKMVKTFTKIEEAKEEIHRMRAVRYATDADGKIHPEKLIEYEKLGHDNFYNLIKFCVVA